MGIGFNIAGRKIGPGQPAFVIAEASTNHNGDLDRAKEMVRVAKEIGADCIKFQTFTPEECLTPGKDFTYTSQGKEVTESEIEMFERLAFRRDQWEELMAYCRDQGVLFLTTVQDSVDLRLMLELGLAGIKSEYLVGLDDLQFPDCSDLSGGGHRSGATCIIWFLIGEQWSEFEF